jgi:hypothetical protein
MSRATGMIEPSEAYRSMRSAYARWFWKTPGGLLLLGLGLLLSSRGTKPSAEERSLSGLLANGSTVAGIAVLSAAARDWLAYRSSRSVYLAEE